MSGPVTVVQLTDCHLAAAPGTRLKNVDVDTGFRAALDHAVEHAAPDLLLLTGDLSDDGSAESYRRIREALDERGIPALALPGNHDDPQTLHRVLSGPGIQVLGEQVLGDWHLVLLDSTVAGQVAGHLTTGDLERLAAALDREPDRPTLVALHHQPVAIGSRWMDDLGLDHPEPLFAALAGRSQVRAIVFGHIHQDFVSTQSGISLVGSPATSVQFRPGTDEAEVDPRPPGYTVLALTPGGTARIQVFHTPVKAPSRAP